jgi:hypothetical protein
MLDHTLFPLKDTITANALHCLEGGRSQKMRRAEVVIKKQHVREGQKCNTQQMSGHKIIKMGVIIIPKSATQSCHDKYHFWGHNPVVYMH